MTSAVFLRTLDQRLSERLSLVLLAVLVVVPLGAATVTESLGLDELSIWLTVVMAGGAIGADLSSGALALTLTRPIKRRDYVLSKWLAIFAGAAFLTLLQLGIETAVMALRYPHAFDLLSNNPLYAAFTRLALCAGVAAVLVALSALTSGMNNVILWVLLFVFAQLVQSQGGNWHLPWLARAGTELAGILVPRLNAVDVLRASPPSWFAISSYLSTVIFALTAATVLMNRKEVSYASE